MTSAIAAHPIPASVFSILSTRKLSRIEINLLKHLHRHSPLGTPITVPQKFRTAVAPLWRMALIEVWYRQSREPSGARNQFLSITIDGQWRLNAIVANQPSFESRRLAGFQGRNSKHEQPSEPQQGQAGGGEQN